jgi:two-component system osmolarity sensor histidine kinase EnvZ
MTPWPRTLLWRSVLLIAALLAVAHLAWLQIFRASEMEPRALQAAQQVASVVNLTRAALVTAEPGRRFALLDELAQREGIQVYAGDPQEAVPELPERPFLRIMQARLQQDLGPQTRFALERNGVAGVWVSFRIDEEEFWVSLPRSRIERDSSLRWIGWGALVLALAMIGAGTLALGTGAALVGLLAVQLGCLRWLARRQPDTCEGATSERFWPGVAVAVIMAALLVHVV